MAPVYLPSRAALLLRISQDRDNESDSIPRQLARCRALAARISWGIGPDATHIVAEDDVSAYQRYAHCPGCMQRVRKCTCPPLPDGKRRKSVMRTDRPEFRRLLHMLETGEADGLIAYNLDRLVRDPRDLEDLLDLNVPVEADTGEIKNATTARILCAVAHQASQDTARRVADKRKTKAESGAWCGGGRAFGWGVPLKDSMGNVLTDEKTGRVLLDMNKLIPEEALEIQRMAEQILAGVSLKAVAADLRERQVPSVKGAAWSPGTVRDILLRPRNAGLSVYRGEIVGEGQQEPVLERERWEAVKMLLENPARKTMTGNAPKHLLSLIARCSLCGSPMSVMGGRSRSAGMSYTCRDKGHLRRTQKPVDAWVTDVIIARLSQPDAVDLIEQRDTGPDRDALGAELAKLKTGKANVLKLVGDGTYTAAEAGEIVTPVNTRIREIERTLAAQHMTSPLAVLPLGTEGVRERWDTLPLGMKREIINVLCTVTLLPSKSRYPGGAYFNSDTVQINWK